MVNPLTFLFLIVHVPFISGQGPTAPILSTPLKKYTTGFSHGSGPKGRVLKVKGSRLNDFYVQNVSNAVSSFFAVTRDGYNCTV